MYNPHKPQASKGYPSDGNSTFRDQPTKPITPIPTEQKRKFNMNTPSFQPSVQSVTSKFSALSPKLKEIPVFVPAGMESPTPATQEQPSGSFAARKFNTSTPSFTPSSPYDGGYASGAAGENYSSQFSGPALQNTSQTMQSAPPPSKQQNPYLPSAASVATPSGAADFMYSSQTAPAYPLNYHLYAPAPPPRLAAQLAQHETNANDLFIPNDLRETITKRNEATLQTLPSSSLPETVGVYHSLVPIDSKFEQISTVYHLPAFVYKVNSNIDGLPYALRRLDYSSKLRILDEQPFSTVKKWRSVTNPNVARLRDAFTSVSFGIQGEPALCLVYDYYPLANTLQEQHLTRKLGGKLEPVTDDLLWNYLVQLVGALISIHEAGLHAGSSLTLSKVLVTSKNRVRLGGACVDDILSFEELETRKNDAGSAHVIKELQVADVRNLARLMIELATVTLPVSARGLPTDEILSNLQSSSQLSNELISAVSVLSEADESFDLQNFFSTHLSRRALQLINGLQDSSDYFESQLSSEVENGRLFRLLAKLNFVIDQPEREEDSSGGAFVLKSFKDYLFQSTDEYGKPMIDLSKLLTNLNKLDVGVDEKILLISREEDTCMIVSYKEVKDIIDTSFRALMK